MAITNGYATLAEYKSYISMRGLSGTTTTDTSDDAVIELLIESMSRIVEEKTGRRFWKDTSDTVYYYQANDTTSVKLPDFASITTVAVDYNDTRTYTALTSNDFDLMPDNYSAEGLPITGIELSPLSTTYFPTNRRGIKITGKRGWSAVPKPITDAVLMTVQNAYAIRAGQAGIGGKVTITAAGVVVRPDEIPDLARQVIDNYRPRT